MSRPAGSKNKIIFTDIPPIEQLPVIPDATKLLKPIHYDLTLCIRARREGQFKGLWELSKLKTDGKREIIIDASSRQSMINMVNRQIMKMVIAPI